jgi:hypothetical protein
MEEIMFSSIINTTTGATIAQTALLTGLSLLLGLVIALVYMSKSKYTKSFLMTLVILPMVIMAVMMMVNGNLGTGIAVVGAFSLIRFRSQQATAKEILTIFMDMAVGLATAQGCVTFAVFITAVFCIVYLILSIANFGSEDAGTRLLKVSIPENLDYLEVFDDIFAKYLKTSDMIRVKTTEMGSMFELSYNIQLKDRKQEKQFIDEIRTRNGNLTVVLSRNLFPNEGL